MEQRTLPWPILPVGETNGNFLIRQAAPTAPIRWRGASWNSPIWPNGHFGSSPSGQRLYSGWPLRGSSGQPGRSLWAGGPLLHVDPLKSRSRLFRSPTPCQEMCGYKPFNQPIATMAASRLTSPRDKVRAWQLSPQGAALLRAPVKRIDTPSRCLRISTLGGGDVCLVSFRPNAPPPRQRAPTSPHRDSGVRLRPRPTRRITALGVMGPFGSWRPPPAPPGSVGPAGDGKTPSIQSTSELSAASKLQSRARHFASLPNIAGAILSSRAGCAPPMGPGACC